MLTRKRATTLLLGVLLALLAGIFPRPDQAAMVRRTAVNAAINPFDDIPGKPQVLTVIPAATVAVSAGHSAVVELKFHVGSGYHVNSNKPHADYLIPTTLSLTAPARITIGKVTYPAGTDITLPFDPTDKLNVYSGDFSVSAGLLASPKAAPGTYAVKGDIHYQACNDNSCFPPKKMPVQFDVVVSAESKRRSRR